MASPQEIWMGVWVESQQLRKNGPYHTRPESCASIERGWAGKRGGSRKRMKKDTF